MPVSNRRKADLMILNREKNETTLRLHEEWLLTYRSRELGVNG
jgi:hypothetical protein